MYRARYMMYRVRDVMQDGNFIVQEKKKLTPSTAGSSFDCLCKGYKRL